MATFQEILDVAIEDVAPYKQSVWKEAPDEWPKSKADVAVALVRLGVPAGETATSLAERIWNLHQEPRRQLFRPKPKDYSKMTATQLVQELLKGNRDEELQEALKKITPEVILAVGPDKKIDPTLTLKILKQRSTITSIPREFGKFFIRTVTEFFGEDTPPRVNPFNLSQPLEPLDRFNALDEETYLAVLYICQRNPEDAKKLGEAGIYAQCGDNPGEQMKQAKNALKDPDIRREMETLAKWKPGRKGDCEQPFRSQR